MACSSDGSGGVGIFRDPLGTRQSHSTTCNLFPNAQEQAFSLEPLTTKAVGLHLIFGVTDREPTNWSGEISVSPGRLLALWGWRLGAKMTVEGNRFFIRLRPRGGLKPVRTLRLTCKTAFGLLTRKAM